MTLRIENAAYMDLAARGQWLAAQAARGWYPAGSFFPIWRMKKGPPRTLRYALTPRRDSGALSPEVRALYQQAGWTLCIRNIAAYTAILYFIFHIYQGLG